MSSRPNRSHGYSSNRDRLKGHLLHGTTLQSCLLVKMQILKAVSLGKYAGTTLNKQLTLPKSILKSALSAVPSGALRGTLSANDAAAKTLDVVFRSVHVV